MFSIFTYSEYRISKTWISKIRDFQTAVFSIFTYSRYRKLGFQKPESFKHTVNVVSIENLDFKNRMFANLRFLKSKFSIFTNYRKHGFIKVGEKNPRYPRHRVFDLALISVHIHFRRICHFW